MAFFWKSRGEALSVISISIQIRSEDPDHHHSSLHVIYAQEAVDFSAYISNAASGSWYLSSQVLLSGKVSHRWTLMYTTFLLHSCLYEDFLCISFVTTSDKFWGQFLASWHKAELQPNITQTLLANDMTWKVPLGTFQFHYESCFHLFSDLKVEWVISSTYLVDRPRIRLALTNWLACLKLSHFL